MFRLRFDFKAARAAIVAMRTEAESAGDALAYEGAVKYRDLVLAAIATQKFPVPYKPLEDWYVKKKTEEVGHARFWEYWGHLMGSLFVKKISQGRWAGGVDPSVFGEDGLRVEEYAARHERPGSNTYRPLFVPVGEQFAPGWEAMAAAKLKNIARSWKG